MKKFIPYLFFVFIIPIVFSSCKKDKPEAVTEKWYFEKTTEDVYDKAGALQFSDTDIDWTINDYFLLQADGNLEIATNGDKETGTYKIDKSVFTMTTKPAGSSISITVTATIVEKSASKFTFNVEESYVDGKVKSTFYLKK